MKKWTYVFFFIVILSLAAYSFSTFLEPVPPTGEWLNHSPYLKAKTTLRISADDKGEGIRSIDVSYNKDNKSIPLFSRDYSDRKNALQEITLKIPVDFKEKGIEDGDGIIAVNIRDMSYWNFGRGNTATLKYPVQIDSKPPMIEVLSTNHIVSQGGSEMTVYRVSEDTVATGIIVGEHFFPGQKGVFKDKNIDLTFFSYPPGLPPDKPIFILAEDRAGNAAKKNLPVIVKTKKYRERRIIITDSFLKRKVPEVMSYANLKENGDLLKDFLLINRELRKEGREKIREITRNSIPEIMWRGGFLQFKNSKVESRFADFRTYVYKGKVVDKQYHFGFDLAATRRHSIGASNDGVVVFAGNLGIYGNTVIIDHGVGIFSLYAHMSSISVKKGERVKKGSAIGRTGDTGLAGGDHLHFGILIHGTPVTPIEWWDPRWVRNRISKRLLAVGRLTKD